MFESTHKLSFEAAEWEMAKVLPWLGGGVIRFRVGTCEGIYSVTDKSYIIIAINNNAPGNGHLNDVFEWFENSCKRDKKSLCVADIINPLFFNHLKDKRGFTGSKTLLEKKF